MPSCVLFAYCWRLQILIFQTGKLPSDELVGEVLSFLQPRGLLKDKTPPKFSLPREARQAFEAFSAPSTSTLRSAGVLPLMTNAVEILEQIPMLIEEVSIFWL